MIWLVNINSLTKKYQKKTVLYKRFLWLAAFPVVTTMTWNMFKLEGVICHDATGWATGVETSRKISKKLALNKKKLDQGHLPSLWWWWVFNDVLNFLPPENWDIWKVSYDWPTAKSWGERFTSLLLTTFLFASFFWSRSGELGWNVRMSQNLKINLLGFVYCKVMFLFSTMVHHHFSPPFGRICCYFFHPHLRVKQIQACLSS